ncbi:hypothetical protein L249_4469, partial [Ophiocordyceps polyrhachis-furcata BCC 54312]
KFDCLDRPPFLGSLTYPTFLPLYGPYGPYGRSRSSVTYGGLGPAAAGPASRDPPRPSGRVPCPARRHVTLLGPPAGC